MQHWYGHSNQRRSQARIQPSIPRSRALVIDRRVNFGDLGLHLVQHNLVTMWIKHMQNRFDLGTNACNEGLKLLNLLCARYLRQAIDDGISGKVLAKCRCCKCTWWSASGDSVGCLRWMLMSVHFTCAAGCAKWYEDTSTFSMSVHKVGELLEISLRPAHPDPTVDRIEQGP